MQQQIVHIVKKASCACLCFGDKVTTLHAGMTLGCRGCRKQTLDM